METAKKRVIVSTNVTKEGKQPDPISKDMQQRPGTNRKPIIIKATDRITMHFLCFLYSKQYV